MRLNEPNESVVVVPSVTLDRLGVGSGSLTQAYEERFLFLLLLLREPRLRMIYVTSMPISPAIIEYYLALLPGVIPESRAVTAVLGFGRGQHAEIAQREAAGATPATPSDRGAGPRRQPEPPGSVQHHGARTRRRPVARHTHVWSRPQTRRSWHEDRMPAAVRRGGRTSPAWVRGLAHARRARTGDRHDAIASERSSK